MEEITLKASWGQELRLIVEQDKSVYLSVDRTACTLDKETALQLANWIIENIK